MKAGPADVHILMGRDPCTTRHGLALALRRAGWTDVRIGTVGHLARAWSRTWPTFGIGVLGDLAAAGTPARRSTLIAVARRPDGPAAP